MGLDHNTTALPSGGTSLSIVGGKWTKRVEPNTPGAEPRKLTKGQNEGREVWELKYPSVRGKFVFGSLGEHPGLEGIVARMVLDDGEEQFEIMMSATSKLLADVIRRLPFVNPYMEVGLELGVHKKKKTKSGGDVCTINVVQNGKVLGDYYTEWKDDGQGNKIPIMLNDCPEATKGMTGWDFREQTEFLLNKFKEFFDKLNAGIDYAPPSQVDEDIVHEDDEDDIPF